MSSENPDIRQQVDANRGIAKKLELLVPGLRTYRKLEDIRVSDDLLRNQVADKLDQAKANLEALRKQMAASGDFTNLTSVGSLISQFQQFSGEVRHAQQGYSGFAASIQMDEAKLNKLYNYDYDFVSASVQLLDSTSPGKLVYDSTSPASITPQLSSISNSLMDVKKKWAVRIEAIQNILIT
ncbi:MAG TPA: hypothetical protein VFF30_11375 [Nitrososphaerales archaeon]|nr:hypothetical protein [Nitrososphaerales archaeon]